MASKCGGEGGSKCVKGPTTDRPGALENSQAMGT